MLKLEKRITLHTFEVEYIDQREPKPRKECTAGKKERLTA